MTDTYLDVSIGDREILCSVCGGFKYMCGIFVFPMGAVRTRDEPWCTLPSLRSCDLAAVIRPGSMISKALPSHPCYWILTYLLQPARDRDVPNYSTYLPTKMSISWDWVMESKLLEPHLCCALYDIACDDTHIHPILAVHPCR